MKATGDEARTEGRTDADGWREGTKTRGEIPSLPSKSEELGI